MARRYLVHGIIVILVALAALVVIRLHSANGATMDPAEGHRLAEAWCKTCHVIDIKTTGPANAAPDFAAVANQPSTTELSLKVFLRSNHHSMPNLILSPDQADDLVTYILTLKGR